MTSFPEITTNFAKCESELQAVKPISSPLLNKAI